MSELVDVLDAEPTIGPLRPCEAAPGDFDHDWKYISDWYGDPNVINGTADCSHWQCRECGEEDWERGPPCDLEFDF